jgi:hypothetical protein
VSHDVVIRGDFAIIHARILQGAGRYIDSA